MFNFFSKPKLITNPLDADIVTFEALKNANANFAKEHIVDFLFIGGEGLRVLQETLESEGFYPGSEQNAGQLLMHKKMILELASMQSLSVRLEALANKTDTDYDGWGAVVVK